MATSDEELHRAKRELEALVARMRQTEHARAFLCYADALVFAALRDLPRQQYERPDVPHEVGKFRASTG